MDLFCGTCERYSDINLNAIAYGGFRGPHCVYCYTQIDVDFRNFAILLSDELELIKNRLSVLEARTITVVNLGT